MNPWLRDLVHLLAVVAVENADAIQEDTSSSMGQCEADRLTSQAGRCRVPESATEAASPNAARKTNVSGAVR